MKKFNVMRKATFQVRGEEKTKWLPVGTIIQFENGGLKLELNHTSDDFVVFEDRGTKTPEKTENAQEVANLASETHASGNVAPTNEYGDAPYQEKAIEIDF